MENTLADRTNRYHSRLKGWRAMHSCVANPRFNATKEADFYSKYLSEGDWLKAEAESLWNAGVNVY